MEIQTRMFIQQTTQSSTHLIDEIKLRALELSSRMGCGVKLEVNALKNDCIENCKVKLTMDVE